MIFRRAKILPTASIVALAVVAFTLAASFLAAPAAGQDQPLGQPAGWAVEDSVSLIAIAGGSELFLEPDPASMVLDILPDAQLPLVETRDRWVKVRYGDRVGWVDLEARREVAEAPPVEVTFVEAKSEPLNLGPEWQEGELGPYELFSKVEEPALLVDLDRVASGHARVYAERYGLEVAAELTGTVALFAGRQAFLEFKQARGHGGVESRIDAYFSSPDKVVMYRGNNSRAKLAATLIHELTHLVSWRTLRASGRVKTPLPPWLAEGMAEDMSLSKLDRKGRLVGEPLTSANLRYSHRLGKILFEFEQKVSIEGTAPSLPQLLAMDHRAFFGSDSQLNYLMSALWIRYLLSDSESQLARGFREFLASVSQGEASDPESLRSRLGSSWAQLAGGFRGWLVVQQARVGF